MPIFLETCKTDPRLFTDQQLVAGNSIYQFKVQTKIFTYRIVDFERDPPPGVTNFGKIHLELWDVSGDFKYEKCWAPMQKDAHGIIFVYDPANPGAEDVLN